MSEFETVFGLRREGLVRDFESLCVVTLGLVQGGSGDRRSIGSTRPERCLVCAIVWPITEGHEVCNKTGDRDGPSRRTPL